MSDQSKPIVVRNNTGCSLFLCAVVVWIVLCAGDPDLIDALVAYIFHAAGK